MARDKLSDLVKGLTIVVFVWLIFPFLLIKLNQHFSLPILSSVWVKIIGAMLFVPALSIVLYFTWLHVKTGRTTPLPLEPPKQFLTTGFYKYSRNPMYVAIITVFFSVFLLFGHVLLLGYVLVALSFLHVFVVYIEEPELKRKFGEAYLHYCKKIPRWL